MILVSMTRWDAVGSGLLVALGIETIGQIFNLVGAVLGIGVLNFFAKRNLIIP